MLRRVVIPCIRRLQGPPPVIHAYRNIPVVTHQQENYQGHNHRRIRRQLLFCGSGLIAWLGLDKADAAVDGMEEDEPDREIIDTIKRGVIARMEGHIETADTIFHVALRMAQDMNHYNAISYIYSLMANMAFEQKDYLKAESLYKQVIQRQLNKGVGEKDNSIIEMSLKLAVIYGSWKQHEKAHIGFRYCIEAQEQKMKSKGDTSEDTHALWGMSRDWYAQYLLEIGNYSEALNQFQEAFLTSCELFGDNHPQTLVLLNSLGTVASMSGNDAKAVTYFQKAVSLGRSTDSENLSTFLVNIGMAKIKLNLRSDANSVCQEALQLAKALNLSEVIGEAEECIKLAGRA